MTYGLFKFGILGIVILGVLGLISALARFPKKR